MLLDTYSIGIQIYWSDFINDYLGAFVYMYMYSIAKQPYQERFCKRLS
jgi:hypothetical protein